MSRIITIPRNLINLLLCAPEVRRRFTEEKLTEELSGYFKGSTDIASRDYTNPAEVKNFVEGFREAIRESPDDFPQPCWSCIDGIPYPVVASLKHNPGILSQVSHWTRNVARKFSSPKRYVAGNFVIVKPEWLKELGHAATTLAVLLNFDHIYGREGLYIPDEKLAKECGITPKPYREHRQLLVSMGYLLKEDRKSGMFNMVTLRVPRDKRAEFERYKRKPKGLAIPRQFLTSLNFAQAVTLSQVISWCGTNEYRCSWPVTMVTSDKIAAAIHIDGSTVRRALDELVNKGLLARITINRHRFYTVTDNSPE